MTEEEARQGMEWFIRRYCQSTPGRNFALRMHNLVEMTPDQAKKRSMHRGRHAAYDFRFVTTAHHIVIEPLTDEAEWARGVIWRDNSDWAYRSTGKLELFTSLDRPA